MDKRLKYDKYRGLDNIITIDLHNDYNIIAIISDGEDGIYNVELRLKGNTFERWDLIEETEYLEFKTTPNKICSAILKKVSTLLEEGFFDYYINRHKYEMYCFDRMDEMLEKERIKNASQCWLQIFWEG